MRILCHGRAHSMGADGDETALRIAGCAGLCGGWCWRWSALVAALCAGGGWWAARSRPIAGWQQAERACASMSIDNGIHTDLVAAGRRGGRRLARSGAARAISRDPAQAAQQPSRVRLGRPRLLSQHADLGRRSARCRVAARAGRRRGRRWSTWRICPSRASGARDSRDRCCARRISPPRRLCPRDASRRGRGRAAMAASTPSTRPRAATARSAPATNGPAARCAGRGAHGRWTPFPSR